jgi:hypothetical protein
MKIYKIINENGGWDNFSMVKIETCLCESKAEAVEIERRYYDELNENKMNSIRAMITTGEAKKKMAEYGKQYSNDNKAKIQEYYKQYYIDNKQAIKANQMANKEKIASRVSEKIYCKYCNCYNSRQHILTHNKTKKHQNNINKLQNTTCF